MHPQTPSSRASKGTVKVIASNGRLQLRFRHGGKRHYLTVGLPDTPTNRIAAEAKAQQIYLDIVSGNFDPTLAKYKPQSAIAVDSPDITPKVTPTASDLLGRYIEYKASSWKVTTLGDCISTLMPRSGGMIFCFYGFVSLRRPFTSGYALSNNTWGN